MQKKSLSLAFLIKISAAALSFIIQPFLLKLTDTVSYGYYSFYLTSSALLLIFMKFGMDVSLVRKIAISKSEEYKFRVLTVSLFMLFINAFFVTSGFFIYKIVTKGSFSNLDVLIIIGALALALSNVMLAFLRGIDKPLFADAVDSILRVISLALLSYALIKIFGKSAFLISNAHIFSSLIISIFIIASVFGGHIKSITYGMRDIITSYKDGCKESALLLIGSLLSFVLFQMDTMWLAKYASIQTVGGYNMACNVIRIVPFFAMLYASQVQAKWARLNYSNVDALRREVYKACKLSLFSALLAILLLVIIGERLLSFFSNEYNFLYVPMLILALGHIFNSVFIVIACAMQMSARQKEVVISYLAGALIAIVLYWLVIPRYLEIGASVAAAAGMFISSALISFFFFWKKNSAKS